VYCVSDYTKIFSIKNIFHVQPGLFYRVLRDKNCYRIGSNQTFLFSGHEPYLLEMLRLNPVSILWNRPVRQKDSRLRLPPAHPFTTEKNFEDNQEREAVAVFII
jgi:hypothetical protein